METTNNLQRSINDISFTLSFSFFWVAFHENVQIAGGIVMLSVIYMIKINEKARNWISIFLKSKNFEVELDETKDLPIVIVKGNHDPNNLASFQYLCVDLSEIFFEIKPRKFREVQLELQITNTSVEKILPLIFSIAENHGIKLSYQKKII